MNKYIGVENTNGNRYEETISVAEFMSRIDLSKIEDEPRRDLYESLLDYASCEELPIKHIDTHIMPDSNEWRVQLCIDVDECDVLIDWYWIQWAMGYSDGRYKKYFMFWYQFSEGEKAFHACFTFGVPGKD